MVQTKDPMLDVFRKRDDANVREQYMKQVENEAAERNGTTESSQPMGAKPSTTVVAMWMPRNTTASRAMFR